MSLNANAEACELYNQLLKIILSFTALKYSFIIVKEVSYLSLWILRNVWFIVTGNYEQIGRLLNELETFETNQRRTDFINLFQHLKPKTNKEIVENNLDDVLTNYCDEFKDDDGDWESEVRTLEKELFNYVNDDSGYFDGDLSSLATVCEKL